MNKWIFFILGWCVMCLGREPFKPRDGSLPFLVYYLSHCRGICVGTLVSRTAVITAAVCIVDPSLSYHDTRPINVITGATYRHPRRGIRVQVTKILIPKLSNITSVRAYMVQKAPAILLLARKVPDVLAEIPLRPLEIDYKGDVVLSLHDECLILGWHFFYRGVCFGRLKPLLSVHNRKVHNEGNAPISYYQKDKIYPVHKFLLQRNIRVQYLIIVKKSIWCNTITLKFQKAMTNLGYMGQFDTTASICLKDGMYGAPLLCHGKMVGMLMAPDAQWTNCTGFTSIIHIFKTKVAANFMECVSRLFDPEFEMNWEKFKKNIEDDDDQEDYDYLPELYDRVMYDSSTSEET